MIDGVQIPARWCWATFDDVAEVASDLVDPTLTPGATHIAPNHIESWTGKLLPFTTVAEDGVTSAKNRFWPGQILYSKIRPYLAKAALATFEGVCSADMYPVAAKIDARFLLHWILTPWFTGETARNQGRTILPKINRSALGRLPVPVAPLHEQQRIGEKIEELFSDLEAGVAALTRAKGNLKRYRASVLKAAVEGWLTADWRAEHPTTEPASKLLARILTERRRQWEADQLAKFTAANKPPPKNWQAKYTEPTPPDTSNGWNIDPFEPDNWRQLSEFITSLEQGWSPKCESEASNDHQEWTVMKTSAIQPLRFIDVENKRLPNTLAPRTEFELQPNDLLITRAGPRNRAGVTCLVRQTRPRVILCDKAYRVRFDEAVIHPAYVEIVLNAPTVLDLIDELKTGISDSGVNLTQKKFGELRVPVPSLAEQAEIVGAVSEKLSQIEAAEVAIEHSLRRAARLRQSILKQAFEGTLVPQDPTDEPASTLLERIRVNQNEDRSTTSHAQTVSTKPRRRTK